MKKQPVEKQVVLTMLLLVLCGADATALVTSWSECVSKGVQLKSAGRYPDAIGAFREALSIAEAERAPGMALFAIHDHLASSYAEVQRFSDAAQQYRVALGLLEKIEGTSSLDYALVVSKATLLPGQGLSIEKSIDISRQALTAYQTSGATEKLFQLRNNLAQILIKDQRFRDAEVVLFELRAALPGNLVEKEVLADSLTELGAIRFNQRRFPEAAALYLESLHAHEKVDGTEHPHLIWPLNNLATAYAKAGRLSEASVLYERAIRLCARTIGEDKLVYGILLQNYGGVLRKLGQKREGQLMSAKGSVIRKASLRRNGADSTVSVDALR